MSWEASVTARAGWTFAILAHKYDGAARDVSRFTARKSLFTDNLGTASGTGANRRTVSCLVMQTSLVALTVGVGILLGPCAVEAQTFEGPGSRAQGMGGAFVALADDASAAYWNPAGLASGAYFSFVLDRTDAETNAEADSGGSRSSWLLALTMPAGGLSYYRLRSTFVSPAVQPAAGPNHVDSLVTHHAGGTLVHSLFGPVAVGATVKFVRGLASEGVAGGDADQALDDWDLMGVSTNRFDIDAGVMAAGDLVRAGVTFRNLTEPGFRTQSNTELHLDRQVRAGVALVLTRQWTAAADFDLTQSRGPFGDVRSLALGTEGRLTPRAAVRAGFQLNTAGSDQMPTASVGATYSVFGSLLVDAHFITGSDHGFRGWGVAGRMVF